MKSIIQRITLCIVTVAMTASALALSFASKAAADAYYERERQKHQAMVERIKEALANDDDAVLEKEFFEMGYGAMGGDRPHTVLQEFMHDCEIPPERVSRILDRAIRESVNTFENETERGDEARKGSGYHLFIGFSLLQATPDANTLALLKECALSKNKSVRKRAIETYLQITPADALPFLEKLLAKGLIWRDDFIRLLS